MPQVPKLSAPQVQQQGFGNVRVNTEAPLEAFGGGASVERANAATRGFAETAIRFEEQERNRANDLATKEAYFNLVRKKQELIYDPKTGAMNRRGKDAFNVSNEYGETFDKSADEIEKGLANEPQRQMFREMRLRERLELTGQLERHTFNEARQYEKETTEAGLAVARDEAVLNFRDTKKIQDSIGLQRTLIMDQAQKNGEDAALVELKIKRAESQTHASVIRRMLANGDDVQAKKYYEEFKQGLSADDVSGVEDALEEGSLLGESIRNSDQIMAKHSSLSSAMKEAAKIEDPKVRVATEDRLSKQFNQREAAKRDSEERMYLQATNILEKGGSYTDIPENIRMNLPLPTRNALRSYNQREDASDLTVYMDFKTQASTPELRDQFLKTDFTKVANLSIKDKREFIDLQASERQKAGSINEKLGGFMTAKQVVDNTLPLNGIDLDSDDDNDKKFKAGFYKAVQDKMVEHKRNTGKDANSDEVQKFADDLLIESKVPGSGFLGFFEDTRRSFEITIDDIPEKQRKAIEKELTKAFREQGSVRQASQRDVLEYYRRSLTKKAK